MAEEERPAESSDSCKDADKKTSDGPKTSACKLDDDEGSQQSMKLILEDSASPGDADKEPEETIVAKLESELAQAPGNHQDEQEEVGVVGQPEAVSELLQEDELLTESTAVNNLDNLGKKGSALPTDGTNCTEQQPMQADVSERVARWVENATVSTRANSTDSPSLDKDESLKEENNLKKSSGGTDAPAEPQKIDTRTRSGASRRSSAGSRESNGGGEAPAGRGSQKVVTNIIRRSIRW
ncbi:hypothetical protein QAD02_015356 [Eretmocerus hayati]|uniref:Uncharacterized protein n=1 Tax=Eretmocerus hayati TaxID=131215 RepID=A0ACC2P7L0_9HYME|nr:hypothetical protein QAD02_015356 [Eretmocerus hayati]